MNNKNEFTVVRVSNISNFDFTGPLGARYGGRDFFIPAGKSRLFPLPLGDHLATHLARAILLKDAPVRDDNHEDGRGGESKRNDRPIFNEDSIKELKKKLMKEEYEEDHVAAKSEMDIIADKVQDLNKFEEENESEESEEKPVGGNTSLDLSQIDTSERSSGDNTLTYQDKGEVIAELNKRGISFDARADKDTLQDLLSA